MLTPPRSHPAVQGIDYVFIALYTIETIIKWLGLTVSGYFRDSWNVFDFVLIVISYVEVSLSDLTMPFQPMIMRLLRIVRVVRLLRIVRSAQGLRTIVMTVWVSLPQLKNIMLLILLLIIITDMFCVTIFYAVNYTPGNFDLHGTALNFTDSAPYARGERFDPDDYFFSDSSNWGNQINRHANFGFFWVGFLTLIRSATGESFNAIMHDLYGPEWGHNRLSCCPQCGPVLDGNGIDDFSLVVPSTNSVIVDRMVPESSCGNSIFAFAIYYFFQVTMAYIVLSIMIGVILENFANMGMEANRKVTFDDIEAFRRAWLAFDPRGTFVIESHQLLPLLQSVHPPLGFKGHNPPLRREQVLRATGALNIPDHSGWVHFTEVLTAASYMVAGQTVPECDVTKQMRSAISRTPRLKMLDLPTHNSLTNYSVSLIGARFRAYQVPAAWLPVVVRVAL